METLKLLLTAVAISGACALAAPVAKDDKNAKDDKDVKGDKAAERRQPPPPPTVAPTPPTVAPTPPAVATPQPKREAPPADAPARPAVKGDKDVDVFGEIDQVRAEPDGSLAVRFRASTRDKGLLVRIPADKREEIRTGLDLKLPFLDFAPVHFISALHGTGVGELMRAVPAAYDAAFREMPTPELTRVLEEAIQQHQPPLVRGRRIKLRYAHQGGRNPPVIVIHGNQTPNVPDAYARYLMGVFRTRFHLQGTPVRIEFRTDDNPFKGKRNPLTPRQRRSRSRLMRKVGKRK